METRDRLFIGNEWVAPATDRTIDVISPITEEVYARTPDGSPADIDRAVAAARDAFDNGPWPNSTPDERADAIAALSQALQKRGAQIADVVTNENGSPASQSMGMQVFAATMVLDIYADIARSYPGLTSVSARWARRSWCAGHPSASRRGSFRGMCRSTSWR